MDGGGFQQFEDAAHHCCGNDEGIKKGADNNDADEEDEEKSLARAIKNFYFQTEKLRMENYFFMREYDSLNAEY